MSVLATLQKGWHHPDESKPLEGKELETLKAIETSLGPERMSKVSESMKVRFIRGYAAEKEPVADTIKFLNQALDFRSEKKVDDILGKKLAKQEQWCKAWPGALHGFDKWGRPVYVERPGSVDPKKVLKDFTIEEMLELHVRQMELICDSKDKVSAQRGFLTYKHVVILDLKGLGSAHFGSEFRGAFKQLTGIDGNFYPESLSKLFVINAPFAFKMIWAVVKPWLHTATQARINIIGENYEEELLKTIDKDQLPTMFGGSCKCGQDQCLFVDFDHANGLVWPPPAATPAAKEEAKEEAKAEAKADGDSKE